MWAHIHPDRNTWATSGPAGKLQESVVLCPLWQELPGRSGYKLRLLEGGAASTVSGALASSEPAVTLWEDVGPRPHNRTLTSSGPTV